MICISFCFPFFNIYRVGCSMTKMKRAMTTWATAMITTTKATTRTKTIMAVMTLNIVYNNKNYNNKQP